MWAMRGPGLHSPSRREKGILVTIDENRALQLLVLSIGWEDLGQDQSGDPISRRISPDIHVFWEAVLGGPLSEYTARKLFQDPERANPDDMFIIGRLGEKLQELEV
jgi:hypothetical protein